MGKGPSKGQQSAEPQSGGPARENIGQTTKKVFLLHQSDTDAQKIVVKRFRRALNDFVRVEDDLNIAASADDNALQLKDPAWLDAINNVVLICLRPDIIPRLEKLIGRYVKDGRLNGKVFTVSFGESLGANWPPSGVRKATGHTTDFAFKFEKVDELTANDFADSDQMNKLIGAINTTH